MSMNLLEGNRRSRRICKAWLGNGMRIRIRPRSRWTRRVVLTPVVHLSLNLLGRQITTFDHPSESLSNELSRLLLDVSTLRSDLARVLEYGIPRRIHGLRVEPFDRPRIRAIVVDRLDVRGQYERGLAIEIRA